MKSEKSTKDEITKVINEIESKQCEMEKGKEKMFVEDVSMQQRPLKKICIPQHQDINQPSSHQPPSSKIVFPFAFEAQTSSAPSLLEGSSSTSTSCQKTNQPESVHNEHSLQAINASKTGESNSQPVLGEMAGWLEAIPAGWGPGSPIWDDLDPNGNLLLQSQFPFFNPNQQEFHVISDATQRQQEDNTGPGSTS
ncbi:hypothetical protein TSUD_271610 [Trifolium subterraneum]|uniref:Uncharacterized protein n=1 Tax=Trifolium subterraneum TaxID=3900 RepID=A0A2Z6NHZ2_TRISU|nr:hypothetical protein TSUD_271610 [Trifolium subterraneum]